MIKNLHKFAFVAVLALAACTKVQVEEADRGDYLVVSLDIATGGASTKADTDTWGDFSPSEAAIAYENTIDRSSLQVLVYDATGNYIDRIEDFTWTQGSDTETYTLSGKLAKRDTTGGTTKYYTTNSGIEISGSTSYKLAVYANCDAVSTTASLADATSSLSYDFKATDFDYTAPVKYLPMWGVLKTEFDLSDEMAGESQNVGTIYLLRAVAKVHVYFLSTGTAKNFYNLNSASINYNNSKGYCMPLAAASVDATTDIYTEDAAASGLSSGYSFNPYAAGASGFATDAINDEVIFYLPEYDNLSDATKAALLSIKLTNKSTSNELTFNDAVEFINADGDKVNIIRNHVYNIAINSVTEGEDHLRFKVTIEDLTLEGEYYYEY